MYPMLVLLNILVSLFLLHSFSIIHAVTYSDRYNYDAYGTLIASTDHFVVLAQNDDFRYTVPVAPFGMTYVCNYNYTTSNNFVINVAAGRRQNASQLSFVYLQTNSTDGQYQKLGFFTFSLESDTNSSIQSCNQMLSTEDGEHEVKVWNRQPSEMLTLQVDPDGKYAYGFLSNAIFIYDIENSSVYDLSWNDIFPSIYVDPHALDIGQTNDGIAMAILVGYYQFDIGKTLPVVYLIRLNPPYNMTVVDKYILVSSDQKFVPGRYSSTYQFDYVMSVSIHDSTQQVLVGVPQLSKTYLFSFDNTNLTFIYSFNYPTRSVTWLDKDGIQAGLLFSSVTTLPWARSQVQVINISTHEILYAYPNNQQILEQWSNTPPTFIQLTKTHDYQLVILTTDETVVLVPSTDAGYYMETDDINAVQNPPKVCPYGTYKSMPGPTPCTICPTMTRSSPINVSSNGTNPEYPTISCTACSSDSFCPLASISNVNLSTFQSISQAYTYPSSSSSSSFDDILMQNTFSLQANPRRCLIISPFFWALITLFLAFIILLIMGVLYNSPTGVKHFHRLENIFRHSDLIGNGELWFGGLISFSVIVLIIYCFWFGAVFAGKYPIETSSDADFACDPTLRNAQLSSALQLSATIKSDDEAPIFNMLDLQDFTMTINFLQTGYTCDDVSAQENIGTYSVEFVTANCTKQVNDATLSVTYPIPYHQIIIQINLTGSYYTGGVFICLTGPRTASDDSSYVVQEMNYCELFYAPNQTVAQTTEVYFALTKVVNQTQSLDYSNSNNYSGIWIPTATHGSFDDHHIYDQRGAFLRYLSTQQTIIISFSETQFYVINQQQPIARAGEILFHNVLFTTAVIGIFALAFLIFKLTFMPILQWIITRKIFKSQFIRLRRRPTANHDNSF